VLIGLPEYVSSDEEELNNGDDAYFQGIANKQKNKSF